MNIQESLYSQHLFRMAEQDLQGDLQTATPVVLSHDDIAKQVCMSAPEFVSGPFRGFKRVLSKNLQDPMDKQRFLQQAYSVDGRILLLPTPDMSIMRTLVKVIDTETVMLTSIGERTKLHMSAPQKTLLSAVNGFNDPSIGTHRNGIKTEPGHVTLTSAVVLGAYKPKSDIHSTVHAFEDRSGIEGNILAASTTTSGFFGVALHSRQFTYETWPNNLQLLWHPEEKVVHKASDEDAVARVQAAGFVALREIGKVGDVVSVLGGMR